MKFLDCMAVAAILFFVGSIIWALCQTPVAWYFVGGFLGLSGLVWLITNTPSPPGGMR